MKNVWTVVGIVLIVVFVLLLIGSIGMMGFGGLGMRGMMNGGMMDRFGGFGMMGAFSPIRWILSLVFWAFIIGGIVALVAWFVRGGGQTFIATTTTSATPTLEDPIGILKMRYAKGEITKEQYESMKQDLA
ncbi:MAG: SHOCT domain-containing protein [Chloroflexi bacterium]|nr:SHOCT domain-containing protein [Chloroflexota bacterium]